MICPHCNTTFTEDYSFCPSCEKQVLCLICGKTIIPNKTKCLYCGGILSSNVQQDSTPNTFTLEESYSQTERTRKISLSFSDNAINSATPILSAYAPLSRITPAFQAGPLLSSSTAAYTDFTGSEPEFVEPETATRGETTIIRQDGTAELTGQQVSAFFELDSKGFLVAHTTDFKGTTKQLQQQRFAVFYTAGYQQIVGNPVPNRTHLNSAAKQNKIYDSNFPSNVSKVIQRYLTDTDGQIKLTQSGKTFVATIIAEMNNEEIVGHQIRSGKSASKRTRANKASLTEVEKWLEKSTTLVSFDIRTIKAPLDLCLFALHDITKEMGVQQTVKPPIAYEYLTRRYKTVSIQRASFISAFGREYNKKYLERAADGGYFLTPQGESHISELLTGARVSA